MKLSMCCNILLLLLCLKGTSQEVLTWDILADVTWTESHNEETGIVEFTGEFSDHLLSYDGQEVIISG